MRFNENPVVKMVSTFYLLYFFFLLKNENKKIKKPVADFTDILSGENYVTVSSLLPMLAHLEGVLEESDDDTDSRPEACHPGADGRQIW